MSPTDISPRRLLNLAIGAVLGATAEARGSLPVDRFVALQRREPGRSSSVSPFAAFAAPHACTHAQRKLCHLAEQPCHELLQCVTLYDEVFALMDACDVRPNVCTPGGRTAPIGSMAEHCETAQERLCELAEQACETLETCYAQGEEAYELLDVCDVTPRACRAPLVGAPAPREDR